MANDRGKRRKSLTRDEKIQLENKIKRRNQRLKNSSTKQQIPINDPRRRINSEEEIQRAIINERRRYEQSVIDDDGYDLYSHEKEIPARNKQEFQRNVDRKKTGERSRKKKNPKKKLKISTIIKVVVIALIAFIGFNIFSVMSTVSKISNKDMISPRPVPMDKTVNILLLGMDVGNINKPKDKELKRTDTIMVLNFNPKTKKVNLVSIPRDTKIKIKNQTWKINAAYPVGGEAEVVRQVEGLLHIDINYMAKINYTAFRDIIDAIGGVDMEIKHNMDYTDKSQNLRIKFKKGTTEHLDGKKAEEFFRWRKNNDGTGLATGDLGRIQNQHEFMEQVIKKCTSPAIILKLPKILKAVEKNVSTNMPGKTMLGYALKAIGVSSSNFKMTTIAVTPKMIGGQSYVIFNEEKNKELIKTLQQGSNEIGLGNMRVMVLNSTKTSGLAARYKMFLENDGFKNVEIDSNDENSKKSYAMVRNNQVKELVKPVLKGISNYKDIKSDSKYSSYDLVIVLGNDQ